MSEHALLGAMEMNASRAGTGVLLTHGRNRIAYGVLRSLRARGIPVHVGDSRPGTMCARSRLAAGTFVYPSPFADETAFVDRIVAEAHRRGCGVVMPVLEEGFALARQAHRLPPTLRLAAPAYAHILLAHDKWRWAEQASSLGIATPIAIRADALISEPPLIETLRFPVLLKPRQGGGAWAIEHLESPDALRARLCAPATSQAPWERFFVQERITGRVHCVAVVAAHGAVRAAVGYRQVRELPITGGQATARISEDIPAARDALQRFVAATGWHGVCQADFLVEQDTGIPYLIDLNPRLWGSVAQAVAAGIDVPWLLYRLAIDGDLEPQAARSPATRTRWLGGELGVLLEALQATPRRWDLVRAVSLPGTRAQAWDDLVLSDPLPFLTWLFEKASGRGGAVDTMEGVWS